MLTLKLWHALHDPPSIHPIFRRTVVLPTETYQKRRYLSWANLIILVVLGLGEHIPTLLLFLMPILLFITGIIYGLDCALRVSQAIAREHENNTFQLLSLSPPGPLGTSWTVCTSSLYRNREFDQLHVIVKSSIIVGLVLTMVFGGLALLGQSPAFTRFDNQEMLPTVMILVDLSGVFAAIYAEFVQSTILGCLIGMLIPTYVQNSLDAGLYALTLFLFVQITIYFLTALIGFYILPAIYQLIGFYGAVAEISLTILRVATFFGLRELIIRLVGGLLIARLNVLPSEFDYLITPAYP